MKEEKTLDQLQQEGAFLEWMKEMNQHRGPFDPKTFASLAKCSYYSQAPARLKELGWLKRLGVKKYLWIGANPPTEAHAEYLLKYCQKKQREADERHTMKQAEEINRRAIQEIRNEAAPEHYAKPPTEAPKKPDPVPELPFKDDEKNALEAPESAVVASFLLQVQNARALEKATGIGAIAITSGLPPKNLLLFISKLIEADLV